MPKNKRESLIYTVLMCFTMVLWMSIYNVTLHMGALNLTTIREAWIGFPIAYVFAMCMDWFVVSGPAKGFAFRFLVKPESPVLHKVIAVSCSMVVPMVIIMSMYGALEGCVKSGNFNLLLIIWLTNIPKNFIMALPFQLLVILRRHTNDRFQRLDHLLLIHLADAKNHLSELDSAGGLHDHMVAHLDFHLRRIEVIYLSGLAEPDSDYLYHKFNSPSSSKASAPAPNRC